MAEPVCVQKYPDVLELEAGNYYWCSCGKSSDQPFCDGSHRDTEFTPVELKLDEKSQIAFCGCKHTKNPPHCDGSHNNL